MATFIKIATVTVGSGGASNIEFTSIPQTYTDLVLKISARSARSSNQDDYSVSLNGNTAAFTYKQLYGGAGGGSIVTGSASGSAGFIGIMPAANNTASTFSSQELYFPNYTSSSYKSFSVDSASENNATTNWQLDLIAQLWSSTNAITSITLISNTSSNFVEYSTATLYGINNS